MLRFVAVELFVVVGVAFAMKSVRNKANLKQLCDKEIKKLADKKKELEQAEGKVTVAIADSKETIAALADEIKVFEEVEEAPPLPPWRRCKPLPPFWSEEWSEKHPLWYYWNSQTQLAQWERPWTRPGTRAAAKIKPIGLNDGYAVLTTNDSQDGDACKGDTALQQYCGECAILSASSYPTGMTKVGVAVEV